MRWYFIVSFLALAFCAQSQTRRTDVDSVARLLRGTWRLHVEYQNGTYRPPYQNMHLIIGEDEKDVLNGTLSYVFYIGNDISGSGRTKIDVRSYYYSIYHWYAIKFDVAINYLCIGSNTTCEISASFRGDTLVLHKPSTTIWQYFVKDSAFVIPTPNDYSFNHIVSLFKGSWKWRQTYNPWGGTFDAYMDVHLVISQDADDSANNTISYRVFEDENLQGYGHTSMNIIQPSPHDYYRTMITIDSINFWYLRPLLNHHFLSYQRDTVSLSTTGFDVPVHYFVRDSRFIVSPPSDTGNVNSVEGNINSLRKFFAYPNPAESNVSIRFELKQPAYVSLKVYDMQGKEVKNLLESNETPGIYDVSFDTRNLQAGVYVYRLQINDVAETQKLVFIK